MKVSVYSVLYTNQYTRQEIFWGCSWKFWKVARWASKKRTVARWCCLLRTLHSRLFSRGRRLSWGRNKAQQQQVWHCRGVPVPVCLLTSNSVPPSAFQARSYERSSPPTSLSGGPPTERQGVPTSELAVSSKLPEKYLTIDPSANLWFRERSEKWRGCRWSDQVSQVLLPESRCDVSSATGSLFWHLHLLLHQ